MLQGEQNSGKDIGEMKLQLDSNSKSLNDHLGAKAGDGWNKIKVFLKMYVIRR